LPVGTVAARDPEQVALNTISASVATLLFQLCFLDGEVEIVLPQLTLALRVGRANGFYARSGADAY